MPISNLLSRFLPSFGSRDHRSQGIDDSPEVVDGWFKIYDGFTLLERPEIKPYVDFIEARFRGDDDQHLHMLRLPLARFASLMQLLPASQNYHHTGRGGLLRHQLDCMALAARAPYQLHQLVDTQLLGGHIPADLQFYTEYCFQLRALTHDIGKLQSMFDIVLRIEGEDGKVHEEPYDPMFGEFASTSLQDHAKRLLQEGATSVRYRYRFRRQGGIKDHEQYWPLGARRIIDHNPGLIPSKFVRLHLYDSDSFNRLMKPKLLEIDQKSVSAYLDELGRPSSDDHRELAWILLSQLASSPILGRTQLVRASDGEHRLFVPLSAVKSLLEELPGTYPNAPIPRNPHQCLRLLKTSGYASPIDVFHNDLTKHNHQSGLFLKPEVASLLLGTSLRLNVEEDSLYCSRLSTTPRAVVTKEEASDHHPSVQDADGPQPAPLQIVQEPTPSEPSKQSDHSAARRALLGERPQEGTPPVPETENAQGEVPLEPGSQAAKGTAQRVDPESSVIDAFAQKLEQFSPEKATHPGAISIRDGCVVFSSQFVTRTLMDIRREGRHAPAQFYAFHTDAQSRYADKWRLEGGEIICTPEYSRVLSGKLDLDRPRPHAAPDRTTFDALGELHGVPASADSHSTKPPPARRCRNGKSDQFEQELRDLLDTVRHAHRANGDTWLEFDGQLVRLDFRAIDAYSGDRQKRGKALEMLRALGLYVRHTKATAVFIRPENAEVRACLDDLHTTR